MIFRTGELADPIAEDGAMAKAQEDVNERAVRTGRHTSTGPYSPLAPPVEPRPRWQAFLIRLFRIDYDDESSDTDEMSDDIMPPRLDIDEVFKRAAQTGWYTSEELDFFRRNGIRPATGRATGLAEPVKQRPAWLAFLLRTVLGPAR
jgi:hypothetical protein